MNTISTFRPYLLRAGYLVLVVGLGMEMWPAIVGQVYSMKIDSGVMTCMLWATTPAPDDVGRFRGLAKP